MEKYLADRSYALICRMCQVQAFPSRLHAKGFPAIGKYEPKTPPRTAGVTKCVIGFGRCSGFVRHFCRESPTRTARRPVARAFLALGLRKAEPDSRMLRSLPGRIFDSVARGAVHLRTDTIPGEFVSLLSVLSRFSARCRDCSPPGLSVRPDRKPNAADRKIVAFGCRIGPECRFLSGRPACARAAASSEASYSVRMDTAIICFVMWQAYPPRSCDIAQPRLAAADRFSTTRSPPTGGNSCAKSGSVGNAKAGTAGHMA